MGERLRRLLAPGAVALAAAALLAPAAGAAWVEHPGYDVPGGGVAGCLRVGGPGELAILGALGHTTSATDVLTGLGGPAPTRASSTTLGWLTECAQVATAPGQPPLLAGQVYDGGGVRVALRVADAGGRAVELRRAGSGVLSSPAVALGPRGNAVVAWYEARSGAFDDGSARLFVAARSHAGARWGRPRHVPGSAAWRDAVPALAMDARGRATLAWTTGETLDPPGRPVLAAMLSDDGGIGRAQQVTASGEVPALAVAPNGRALLVVAPDRLLGGAARARSVGREAGSGRSPAVDRVARAAGGGRLAGARLAAFERPSGGDAFAEVALPPVVAHEQVAVALADDGGAAIATRHEPETLWARPGTPSYVAALVRPPGGGFGVAQTLAGRAPAPEDGLGESIVSLTDTGSPRPAPPIDPEHARLSVALGGDGAVLVTWVERADGAAAATALAARGALATGFERPQRLGGPCRTANAIKPLPLPDGRLGVAWTDNARHHTTGRFDETAAGGGRVHAAVAEPDAGAAGAAVPGAARARAIGPPRLRPGQPLRLRVRCPSGRPCDVRAVAIATALPFARDPADRRRSRDGAGGAHGEQQRVAASTTLAPGAAGELRLAPGPGHRIGGRGSTRPRIGLTTCAAAGPAGARRVLRPRLTGLAPRPAPWLRDLGAVRRGGTVRVTWRTAAPAHATEIIVVAHPARDWSTSDQRTLDGAGRRRFAATLRLPERTRRAAVTVVVTTSERGLVDMQRIPVRG